jgi:hypothetical protein
MSIKTNLLIEQGTDYSKNFTVKDTSGAVVNLAGYTGEGQIRKDYSSNNATDFTVTFAANTATGVLTISLSRILTANLSYGRYVYDVELTTSANTRSRLVEGIATITPEVTRSTAFVT